MIPILRGIFVEDAAHLKAIMRYSRPFRMNTAMLSTKDLGASLRMDLKAYRAHPPRWHGRRGAMSMRMLDSRLTMLPWAPYAGTQRYIDSRRAPDQTSLLRGKKYCLKDNTVPFWIIPRCGEDHCDGTLIGLLTALRVLHTSHSSQERNERMTASQRCPLFDRPGTAVSTSSTRPMILFWPSAAGKGLRSCRI